MEWRPRKLKIPPTGHVLEVGSGGRPHPRATVLVDRYMGDASQREGRGLVRDGRPFIIADAAALPFKQDAFAYVLAVHVLEHVPDAPGMLNELSRVARAGYIETPTPLFDFLFAADPYPDIHLWWVERIHNTHGAPMLRLQRKTPAMARQPFGPYLDQLRRSDPLLERWLERRPRLAITELEWTDRIPFEVVDPLHVPASPPAMRVTDPRWSRDGIYWGHGLWGTKRWFYAKMVPPVLRRWAKALVQRFR